MNVYGRLAGLCWLAAATLLGFTMTFAPLVIAAVAAVVMALIMFTIPAERSLLAASALTAVALAFGSIAAPLVAGPDSGGIEGLNGALATLAGTAAALSALGYVRNSSYAD
jgi:hypothetical protein